MEIFVEMFNVKSLGGPLRRLRSLIHPRLAVKSIRDFSEAQLQRREAGSSTCWWYLMPVE
jgi:hypothetical protein